MSSENFQHNARHISFNGDSLTVHFVHTKRGNNADAGLADGCESFGFVVLGSWLLAGLAGLTASPSS
jgi:hypothetical protein